MEEQLHHYFPWLDPSEKLLDAWDATLNDTPPRKGTLMATSHWILFASHQGSVRMRASQVVRIGPDKDVGIFKEKSSLRLSQRDGTHITVTNLTERENVAASLEMIVRASQGRGVRLGGVGERAIQRRLLVEQRKELTKPTADTIQTRQEQEGLTQVTIRRHQTADRLKETLKVAEESREVGEATLEELYAQRKSLERSKKHVEHIHADMNVASRLLRGMESIGGTVVNYFSAPAPGRGSKKSLEQAYGKEKVEKESHILRDPREGETEIDIVWLDGKRRVNNVLRFGPQGWERWDAKEGVLLATHTYDAVVVARRGQGPMEATLVFADGTVPLHLLCCDLPALFQWLSKKERIEVEKEGWQPSLVDHHPTQRQALLNPDDERAEQEIEQGIEDVHDAVRHLKGLALVMGSELDRHAVHIDALEVGVDRAHVRVKKATQRTKALI